jgi:hypothetical protein
MLEALDQPSAGAKREALLFIPQCVFAVSAQKSN